MFNSFRGAPIPEDAFEQSPLLHRMAGGNRLVLTECRRSDARLYGFYASLIPGGARFSEPLPLVLAAAKGEFNFPGPARWNLCISHRKRVQLNAQLNVLFKPEDAVFIPFKRKRPGSLAQNMWIWPGIQLLGCVCRRRRG